MTTGLSTTLGMSEQTLALLFVVFATLTVVLFIIVIVLLCRGRSHNGHNNNDGSTVTKYKPKKQKQSKPVKDSASKQTIGPTFVPFTETIPTVPLSSQVKETKSDTNANVIRRTNAVLQELNTNKPEKKKPHTPPAAFEPKIKQPVRKASTSTTPRTAPQRTTRSSGTTRPPQNSTTRNSTRRK